MDQRVEFDRVDTKKLKNHPGLGAQVLKDGVDLQRTFGL